MQKKIDRSEQVVSTTPVIQRVLDRFLDAVAAEDGYLELTTRLRATLREKGGRSEAALKAALFGPDDA
jgi:hypothetical protein